MTKITETSLKNKTIARILELKSKPTLELALKQQLIDSEFSSDSLDTEIPELDENPMVTTPRGKPT